MKHVVLPMLIAAAAGAGCLPSLQVAQNPVKKGPFTVRVGTEGDPSCMIASSSEKPIFVRSFVVAGWTTPTQMCTDKDGDGFCETSKEIGHEFFLTPGRERYFGDCTVMPDAKGWDFQVFYEEANVGAETLPFSRDASATRPPPASVTLRATPAPAPPTLPAPAPTPTVSQPAPAPVP
ncbi:MAG: hypothetical protein HYZ29_11970 [Myxococcales bacterium]|nr:hypothetical protein [Myxococcales bacterium]